MILLLSVLQLVPLFSIFALVNATDSFDDEITFFPTHPALDYLPRSDCVHRFLGKWCRGRNYAWRTYDYLDEQSGIYRTVSIVTNEHNNGYGNGPREISFRLPRGLYCPITCGIS